MSSPLDDGFDSYPVSGRDISLSPENEAMFSDFKAGIARIVTSDIALTFEDSEPPATSPLFRYPKPRFLGRVAFMKVDGLEETETDDSASPSFQLAVMVTAHAVDATDAETISPEEAEEIEPVWPDGISMTVIDRLNRNRWGWNLTYQNQSTYVNLTGFKRGFVDALDKAAYDDALHGVYKTDSGLESGAHITEDNLSSLEELQLINSIIHAGTFDSESAEALRTYLESSGKGRMLHIDPVVMRNSMPYFKKIVATSLATPNFRDMLAWQQYWHAQR